MISSMTALVGGSGFLAVYLAGLVMANRPTRAYPSIVGFHDAVTWLCQIVMFLVLGLLVTPSHALGLCAAGHLRRAGPDLRRPAAGDLALPRAVRLLAREKVFVSWVGLRGAVSIFLAAIPMLAGVPNAPPYFNIAFFVVLVSLLVQGSTLTPPRGGSGWRCSRTTAAQPGRDRHPRPDRAGDRRLSGDRRQRDPRPQPDPGLGAGADGGAQGPHSRRRRRPGALQPGDYVISWSRRERLPRLDSLFRGSPDVARRLGFLFGELSIRGESRHRARSSSSTSSTSATTTRR